MTLRGSGYRLLAGMQCTFAGRRGVIGLGLSNVGPVTEGGMDVEEPSGCLLSTRCTRRVLLGEGRSDVPSAPAGPGVFPRPRAARTRLCDAVHTHGR